VTPEPHVEGEPQNGETAVALGRAAAIMARLRGPGGCPWDREQTFDTIKRHTLEETYEVFDAIERRDWPHLKDELGDLLLQVLFYAQMASDEGYFTLRDVADTLSAKLIRRHPHVFGDTVADDANAVLRNWEQIKLEEKQSKSAEANRPESLLGDIPRSMPAMLEATKLGSRVAKVGFDWPSIDGLFEKIAEETNELRAELHSAPTESETNPGHTNDRIEDELGDLLFTAVNLARHLRVDPEFALRRANAKFRERFLAMEREAGGPAVLQSLSADELESLWIRAKQAVAEPTTPEEMR
jgi:nucleoside triphosphate diphosphatase